MKNIINKSAGATCAILLLASCSANQESDNSWSTDSKAVKIEATLGDNFASRSNPAAEVSTNFNQDDVIAIGTNDQNAVKYKLSNGIWTPEVTKYLRWTSPTMEFKAYYPGNYEGVSMSEFTLPVGQNTEDLIAKADYMTFAGSLSKGTNGIASFNMTRHTARVVVEIKSFGDQFNGVTPTISNVSITSPKSSLNNSTSTPVHTLPANKGGIGNTYTGLILPTGAAIPNQTFIQLIVNGQIFVVNGIPAMESGKSYTYKLHVGKDAVRISDVTVTDWTTGEIAPGDTDESTVSFLDQNFISVLNTDYDVPLTSDGGINPNDPETKAKLDAIQILSVSEKNISSLEGIEYLTNLVELDCYSNSLTSLDLSQNINLEILNCSYNSLTSLDLSQFDSFDSLNCGYQNNDVTLQLLIKSQAIPSTNTDVRNEAARIQITYKE